jgi:anti-sigma regulatory factor (Ser/Thr protein kinase)
MRLTEEDMVAVRLPATFKATRLARAAIEDVPDLEPHEDLRFTAALLTTELVANAVRHAGLASDADIALLVECSDGLFHVEVSDSGPGFFPLPYAQSGAVGRVDHGLHLVNVLADRWGFHCSDRSCCVWFELDLVPGRRTWRGRQPLRLH